MMSGRDIPRTSSQTGSSEKLPGHVPGPGCLLLGLHASVELGFGYFILPMQGEMVT